MQAQSTALCECGCGLPAPIAKSTSPRRGHVKGEPLRFVNGHNGRVFTEETRRKLSELQRARTLSPETRRKIAEASSGKTHTPEAKQKISEARKQRPYKALSPEHRRNMSLAHGGTGEPSYHSLHDELEREHPKKGVCEKCGKSGGRTEYAFLRHPEPHTSVRADYRELCSRCHRRMDSWLWTRKNVRSSPA